MMIFQNVWWVLVLIGIMILIHELGHYWAAKYFDVRIESFSIGFGPRLFGFRRGETDFRVSLIPFGGYVKMTGDQPGEEGAEDPRGFLSKPRWQRMIIAFAGPGMNIVLAVGLLAGLYMKQFPRVVGADGPAVVGFVETDSSAAKAGVHEGDRIVSINNQQDPTWQDVVLTELGAAGRDLPLVLLRDGKQIVTTISPTLDEEHNVGSAGWGQLHEIEVGGVMPGLDAERVGLQSGDVLVAVNGTPLTSTLKLHQLLKQGNGKPVQLTYQRGSQRLEARVQPSLAGSEKDKRWMLGVQLKPRVELVALSLPDAIRESVNENVRSARLIGDFLRGIVEHRMSAKSLEGPIGIARLSGQAAREGVATFLSLMAAVSLNLAIFNLLPIPILDGGTLLMLAVEMIMRRDLSMQVKETVFKLGFVFLMMVVAFVLYNDISKVLQG